jgi:hypothetical protein
MALEIKKEKAKLLFEGSPEWFKKELIEEFGEDFFKKMEFELLDSFDKCCKKSGTSEEEFNKKFLKADLSIDALNHERLGIINAAINDGWVLDYANHDQRKWFPVFEVSSSGFGFSCSSYRYVNASSGVGSRLCFETEEQSDYSAVRFIKYWEALITNTEK